MGGGGNLVAEGLLDKHKGCRFLHQEPRQRKTRLQRPRENKRCKDG